MDSPSIVYKKHYNIIIFLMFFCLPIQLPDNFYHQLVYHEFPLYCLQFNGAP